uniref:Death domain-containing protein n=1 Tax=Amphimedon queenslandica TaxID=400682 RepID=A0A1X7TMA7_AMPQE
TLKELLATNSISEIQLSVECDRKLFRDLSAKVVLTLPSLVIQLGLTGAEFQQIEKDYEKDYNRQKIEVFQKWRNKNSKNQATYLTLIKAFIEESNMEAAEYVIEFFKGHHPLPISKCHSWTNGHSESTRKSSETVTVRRLSYQESQRYITRGPQRHSSHTHSTHGYDKPYKSTLGHRKSNSYSAGYLQHNNISSQTFDFFCDDLVTILSSDRALFHQFVELVTSYLLTHPIERKKSLRNPCLVIGCKTLINDVWTFINRARNPERALHRVLLILTQIVQLADIAHNIKARALESGVRYSALGDMDKKMKKDHGQLATSC